MNDSGRGKWTRRSFLEAVGRAGGAAALYETMTAMGLLRVPQLFAGPPKLPDGNGKFVVIIGAGIAGLTAGYELLKANYRVQILEAKPYAGGRSLTVRRGDKIHQIGKPDQTCMFDEGADFYLNAGPGRLPYHHTAILHYCNILGVDLEVYTMMARANYFQRDQSWNGSSVPNRQIANDTRGWISELLAKAVRRGSLDTELSGVDKDGLLNLLTVFGDVDEKDDYNYHGSTRSGYAVDPGVEECGTPLNALKLADLVNSRFWNDRFYQAEEYEWQPTLFQPVGGMDKIWKGFLRTPIGNNILYGQELVGVNNMNKGGVQKIQVKYRSASDSSQPASEYIADWCISTIPLPILNKVKDNNFTPEYKKALGAVKEFADTCKVGWQTNDRFWETRDQMYGGISYTTDPITQMWYPSWAYFKQKGILTGAYNYDQNARDMAEMDLKKRLQTAIAGGKKLHPDFDKHVPIDLGLSIAWKQVPYQLGGWADDWECDEKTYKRLLEPEGRFFVAGDQVSYISGWQEGAVRSAHHVIAGISGVRVEKPMLEGVQPPVSKRKAPSIRRRTRGLP